jgi:hypothetical protein
MDTPCAIGKKLRLGNPLPCVLCFAFVEYSERRCATLFADWTESLQGDRDSLEKGSLTRPYVRGLVEALGLSHRADRIDVVRH